MKGLIIKSPWIELILQGFKTWEIRGSNITTRGKIALIKQGTGKVYGTVDLVDSKALKLDEYHQSEHFHRIPKEKAPPYKKIYAWILNNPEIFTEPIPYKHPQGAQIWVNLINTNFKD